MGAVPAEQHTHSDKNDTKSYMILQKEYQLLLHIGLALFFSFETIQILKKIETIQQK